MSEQAQHNLHERLKDVRYFIIDEISTVSQELLVWIHKRLNQAFYNNDLNKPFGGQNVILVGDLAQLKPVGGDLSWDAKASAKWLDGHELYLRFKKVIFLRDEDNKRFDAGDKSARAFAKLLKEIRDGTVTLESW